MKKIIAFLTCEDKPKNADSIYKSYTVEEGEAEI